MYLDYIYYYAFKLEEGYLGNYYIAKICNKG